MKETMKQNRKRLFKHTEKPRAETEAYERCTLCGEMTDVAVNTPIDLRECYEIGCGQLCLKCYQNTHGIGERSALPCYEQLVSAVEKSKSET